MSNYQAPARHPGNLPPNLLAWLRQNWRQDTKKTKLLLSYWSSRHDAVVFEEWKH